MSSDVGGKLKMIFLAWIAHSRRGQLFSTAYSMPLYTVQALKRYYALAPLRYVLQTWSTMRILLRERPEVIFVQSPPVFAVLIVYIYAVLFGARYVIDAHTGALLAPWWRWTLPLHAFLSRRAVTTIVTNAHLAQLVASWDALPTTIPDIPTTFPAGRPFATNGKFSIAVINTYSPDEPIEEILQAASNAADVQFFITGDLIRAKKHYFDALPDNVTLTGFLPDEDYFGLLQAVEVIMVLTTDDHTMQRGACEAVSIGKPIITSNWPVLTTYFSRGTLFVDNSAADITEKIATMRERHRQLAREISILREENALEWLQQSAQLAELIGLSSARIEKKERETRDQER